VRGDWLGRQQFRGPRFDLPLSDLQWTFYVPEQYEYDDFEGTLTVNENLLDVPRYHNYNLQAYDDNVRRNNQADYGRARQLQQLGKKLAEQGRQYDARQALELGTNYAQSDPSLNEDIRVELHNLLEQQAKVGIVGSRDRLRGQTEQPSDRYEIDEDFDQQAYEQMEAGLDFADAKNLQAISQRIIEVQEAAAGRTTQLVIDMPLRGRMLRFNRPLQVTPNADMQVSFDAERAAPRHVATSGGTSLGVFAGLALLLLAIGALARRWPQMRTALAPAPTPAPPTPHSTDPTA
jgi:hypothetical protein